jgi:hypothetical protein
MLNRCPTTQAGSVPPYDIFRGHPKKDPIWVETLNSLTAANVSMVVHARLNPGPYFIFCHATRAVLASIDTSTTVGAQV